jgi:hypothetical protein
LSAWNSIDINLSEFANQGINLASIGQFKFVATPFGGSTVYLDNIYFWKVGNAPTISGFSIPSKVVGDAKFKISAPTSNSTGAFTYSSSNTSVATISNDSITIVGPGSSTITVNQAAAGGLLAGSATALFVVELAPPAVAAPIPPVRNTGDVVSLYSNAYSNVPVSTWSAVWDQANVSDIEIAGDATKKYTNLVGIKYSSILNNINCLTEISSNELNKKLNDWCKANRFRTMDERTVGRILKENGYERSRKYVDWLFDGKGGQIYIYYGLRWKN